MEGLTNRRAFDAAKIELGEQPLAHTSQTGLQELNNLGYSLAVTTNKQTNTCSWICPSQS